MGAPGDELRAAVEDLARQPLDVDLTFDEIQADYRERYGRDANAQIATDAGLPKAPRGSPGWRARQSFLRRIQRYNPQKGGQEKRRADPEWIKDLAQRIGSTRAPGTIGAALHEVSKSGVAVTHIRVKVRVSNEKKARERAHDFTVYIDPEGDGGDELLAFVDLALRDRWDAAADRFAQAWGTAYGIGANVTWEDVEGLRLSW